MERKSFIFYTEWAEALASQEPLLRLEVYDAVIHYVATGEVREFKSPTAQLAFSFIKNGIDHDAEKYEEMREKRIAAAKAKWEKARKKDANDASAESALHDDANDASAESALHDNSLHSVNDNVNVNVNVNENVGINPINNKQQQQQQQHACAYVREGESENDKKRERNEKSEQNEQNEKQIQQWLENFAAWWNEHRKQTETKMRPLGTIEFNKRREGILYMARKYGTQKFAQACHNAQMSKFCNGMTKERTKPAEFDWALLREDNFVRLLEGYI